MGELAPKVRWTSPVACLAVASACDSGNESEGVFVDMKFLKGHWRRSIIRWLVVFTGAILTGCVKYHPKPIAAPQVETEFRSRTLADPGLRAFVEANTGKKLAEWPPIWDLGTLTLAAFYYHPDLDVARAGVGVTEAGIVTAGARPNPTVGPVPGSKHRPSFRSSSGFPWISRSRRLASAGIGLRMRRA
jgi:hypothetical protein